MRKICVVTGTRADYGLLYWLMKEIDQDPELLLQLVVTGTHLETKFGYTKDIIAADGFEISKLVPCHLISDRPETIGNSIAECLRGMLEAFKDLKPDVVVILGDRFEILGVAQACMVMGIPIAHIHGGESTEGLIDEAIRHSVTKMAHFHFCSTAKYKQRIIQMGENPDKVFSLGAPGLDNMNRLSLLDKSELEKSLGIKLSEKIALVTYHPVTLDEKTSTLEIENLVDALTTALDKDLQIIITLPNADTYSEKIRVAWEKFVATYPDRVFSFVNLGQLRYLSLMKLASVIVGNSSSGIVEAPFLGKAVLDIGARQRGRLADPKNVVRVESQKNLIVDALQSILVSPTRPISTLYGEGKSSYAIKEKLKHVSLENVLFKKFFDLESP